jgi:uncharacterized protein
MLNNIGGIKMAKKIFVNLPIKDVNKSKQFFTKLGFEYNAQFSNENALCLKIAENIYTMLLVETFFKTFIDNKAISDAQKSTEVLMAIDASSREEVDDLIEKVEAAGGKEFRKASDHGWMYGRAFEDLDGHIWEVLFMDESKMPEEMKNKGS